MMATNPLTDTPAPQAPSPQSRVSCISHRRSTSIPSSLQIRENQLQWMFNRRKDKLVQTSVQNLRIYNRIKAQKSKYAQGVLTRRKVTASRLSHGQHQQQQQENKENEDGNVGEFKQYQTHDSNQIRNGGSNNLTRMHLRQITPSSLEKRAITTSSRNILRNSLMRISMLTENELKRRNEEITGMLKKAIPHQFKRYSCQIFRGS